MPIGRIIAAALLPPLAVYLQEGVSRNFWIDVGLTCLAFVPGMIFALVVVLGQRRGTVQAA